MEVSELIKENEKLKKEIEKLQFVNNLIIKWNEQLDNECISKDKIRETIKDLEKHKIMSSDEFTIKVLKDLIGE